MAALVIEIPATAQPVSLTAAKDFCRVSTTDEDELFGIMLAAATELAESFTNRSFCIKGFRQSMDSFPYFCDTAISQQAYPPAYYALPMYSTTMWNYSQMIKLFRPPLVSVDRITFLSDDDEQWHDLVPIPKLWYPGSAYAVDNKVMDNNGNVEQCAVAGISDAKPPLWSKVIGNTTTEVSPDLRGEGSGPIQWTNIGPPIGLPAGTVQGQFGAYMVDSDSEPGRIFPGPPGNFWPPVLYVPNAVQIHFSAGYSTDGSKVPYRAKMAILQTVAHWYENRETVVLGTFNELPNHAKALLWSLRIMDQQPTRG